MKKLTIFVLAAVLTLGATSALALGPLDAEAEVSVYSKYVWRGMVNVDDYVLQPNLELGVAGFTAGFWGNVDMTDINSDELADLDTPMRVGSGLRAADLCRQLLAFSRRQVL